MKIRLRSNLFGGIFSLSLGLILLYFIPRQIALGFDHSTGITPRSVPYGVAAVLVFCGAALLFKSLILKEDSVKELNWPQEKKALLYMLSLILYGLLVKRHFFFSTSALALVTLALSACKKWQYYLIVVGVVGILFYLMTHVLHFRIN